MKNSTTYHFKRCVCYEEAIKKQRLKNVGIGLENVKRVADYKTYDEKTKLAKMTTVSYIKNFDKNSGEGICFLGSPGSGKTMLTLGIVKELIKTHNVIYMPYLNTLMDFRANLFDSDYINSQIQKYIGCDLLIIDDIFKDLLVNGDIANNKINSNDLRFIYDIINYRYINNKPMIINSEASPKTLMKIDSAIAGRILERNAIICFEGNKYNYRLKDFL